MMAVILGGRTMKLAVVGLGTMGLGIAQVFAAAGYAVRVTDAVAAARQTALTRLRAGLELRVAKGALTAGNLTALVSRIEVVDGTEDLAGADLVIEAVAEDLAAKRQLFAELDGILRADAVLATNTSSLSVAAVAAGLAVPGRVVGLHFFNPAPVMRLVELIAHDGSTGAALALARQAAEAAGKVVIACPDRPGFVVNRCARPYYGEALAMLEEGRSAGEIDAAMQAAGYRIGPFGLIDLIGADVHLAATEGVWRGLGQHPRYRVFDALRAAVAAGRLGRKSGQGFLVPGTMPPPPADAAAIAERIEAVLVNEAGWLLAEGGVGAADIDTALKLGLNFPRGPFAAATLHGKARLAEVLAQLEARAPTALKTRYLPCPWLA